MKIIIISQDFPPDIGGIQTYTVELARRFHKHTPYMSVIAPYKNHAHKIDGLEPYHIHRILSANTLMPFMLLPELPVIVQKEQPDIIFHTQWQTVIASLKIQKWHKHKIIAAVHGRELFFTPFRKNTKGEKFYLNQMINILNQVDHFFPVSNYTRSLLLDNKISSNKITLFNNGTDPDYFKPVDVSDLRDKMMGSNRFVIMTIARLVSCKGIDTVLESLSIIKKVIPNVLYVIIGDGPDRKRLEDIVFSLDLRNNVLFTGPVQDSERVLFYNMCDVFVMPSKLTYPGVEGFGIVFLEASACAKPVIGSRTGGIPDAIDEGVTGLLVEQMNPRELADAVIMLHQNPALAKKMGDNGRQKVLNIANWDYISTQMLNTLEVLRYS